MDQSNSVHLRWRKHQTTLVSVFDVLLDNEKLTDCTISAEGRQLRAHKIILSACSPYFEELFTGNLEKYPIIILHDVKYDVVKALMEFMYRGEVDVPQEELSGVLKLSETLQIRGLSGSGCVDDVNMQKESGRNPSPVPPETLPAQPTPVSRFTSSQNEPDEKVQPHKGCSPPVSSQGESFVEVDSISEPTQKYRKTINQSESVSDQGTSHTVCEEVITPDFDSSYQLPSQRQVLPTTTMRNSTGGRVYSPNRALQTLLSGAQTTVSSSYSPTHHQSVCNELKSSNWETACSKSEKNLTRQAVLPDRSSADQSSHEQEVSLEIKSEILESPMEIVECLTLDDDDDYSCEDVYHDDCNSAEVGNGVVRRLNEETFHIQGSNNQHLPFGSDYLNSMTLATSRKVLHNRYSCQSCGNSYRYQSGLYRHRKHQCGKEPQFQCPHCNYRCARADNLRKHITVRHC